MEDKEIKSLLAELKIPEPGKEARDKAIRSALVEYRLSQEKKIKGFSWIGRLTGKKHKGGLFMTRPITITAGIATCIITFAIILSPQFTAYRARSTKSITVSSEKREAELPKTTLNPVEEKKMKISSLPKMVERKRQIAQSDSLYTTAHSLSESDKVTRQSWENQEYIGRDMFEKITPNPIKLVKEEPVSTFSIDVDTSSYSFVRRALNNGNLPQKNAVRVEEMINYFDYDYPLPEDRTRPFKPSVAVFPTPWNQNTKLLLIGIKGYDINPDSNPRSNLVFLISYTFRIRRWRTRDSLISETAVDQKFPFAHY